MFFFVNFFYVKAKGIHKGSVTHEKNLSYQHECLHAVLHDGMREVPQEVRRPVAPRGSVALEQNLPYQQELMYVRLGGLLVRSR